VHSSSADPPAWASAVCAGLDAAGARDVVYVPDNPTSHVLRVLRGRFPSVRLTTATREEEAFAIAAGLYLGGIRAAVMLQSSGLGNSLNALTSLLVPYRIPVLMLVSMRGEEDEWNPAQMPMGRAVRSILDAVGIAHTTLDRADGAAKAVEQVGRRAFESRLPAACLLPRRLTAGG
jgi:sulfopyruvate decarboxylase alpha subunit